MSQQITISTMKETKKKGRPCKRQRYEVEKDLI
jgi:hypothetical protein